MLALMWAAHTICEPYEYTYQNVASSWFYVAQFTLLSAATFYESSEGDLRNVSARASIVETTTLAVLVGAPVLVCAYLYLGLRRSRVSGRYVVNAQPGGRKGAWATWEETPVHDGQVPLGLSALQWTPFPLLERSVAIVRCSRTDAAPASEVYARLQLGAPAGGGARRAGFPPG